MELNEYQKLAMITKKKWDNKDAELIDSALGLCGESGEVIDIVKKHHAQGHELDKEKIIEELGDVCWYIAEIAYVLDVKLEDVFEGNIEKLSKRYKNGFTKEESINRK